MLDYLLLFFVAKADTILFFLGFGLVLSVLLVIALACIITSESLTEKEEKEYKGVAKKALRFCSLFLFLILLIPSKEQLMIILGGKLAIDVVKSEEVTETSKKIYQILQKKLDEELKEETK